MTHAATVSVVVVSRDRPLALRRCLLGLSQLQYDPFEIVVVTDAPGRQILRELPQAAQVKTVPFEEANISVARNLGIAHADGDIIAFIDDDAVPEPGWLAHLIAPFQYAEVTATCGFVRGRNGISWQWTAQSVDRTGQAHALEVDPHKATLLSATPDQGVKTQGTNMAFRRQTLVELGGFDPNYRFFLDETDLNLRLAARQACTAVVPLAQVHHGFAASPRRRADRVPTDLTEIGASWAVFLRRHCAEDLRRAAWHRERTRERRRLLRHMVDGRLEPRDVRRLMRGLEEGYKSGSERRQTLFRPIEALGGGFRKFQSDPAPSTALTGHRIRRSRLHRDAIQALTAGRIVTVLTLSLTTRYHQVRFTDHGYWEQTGGLFGKSDRSQPLFRFWRLRKRITAELDRIREVRMLDAPR